VPGSADEQSCSPDGAPGLCAVGYARNGVVRDEMYVVVRLHASWQTACCGWPDTPNSREGANSFRELTDARAAGCGVGCYHCGEATLARTIQDRPAVTRFRTQSRLDNLSGSPLPVCGRQHTSCWQYVSCCSSCNDHTVVTASAKASQLTVSARGLPPRAGAT
jgi:hypothetical protein